MVMRVCHVQLLPLLSGVQRVSLNEISQMKGDEIEFEVVVSEEGPLTNELDLLNVRHYEVSSLKRAISFSKDVYALRDLYRYFRKNQFDVVHTHSSKTGVLGRISAKLAGVNNVVHTVHGFAFPSSKSIFIKLFYYFFEFVSARFTDNLIVLNEVDYNIAERYLLIPKKKIHLIANSIDVVKFSPRKLISDSAKKIRIVMVGRLWAQKNPMCLIKAVNELVGKYDNFSVDIIGDGELRQEVELYLKKNRLNKYIKLLGWRNDVDKILNGYDIFVLPSLWEGMPLAILEAQSCGVPTIVSDIPGNKDLVQHDVNGLIFECDNFYDLSEMIARYFDNAELLKEHSINARKSVMKNFSSLKRNTKVLNIYKSKVI
ncbi:hypothetical protein ACS86_05695 [Vibrio alginolyticus]|nr:hypothetical protein ACS86_05695 [Vibrio alginolyticus]